MVNRQLSQPAREPTLRSENGVMLCCFGESYCGLSRFWQDCEYRGISWNFQTMTFPVYRSWARKLLVRTGWRYVSHWGRLNGPSSWGFHIGTNCQQWLVAPTFSSYVNVWFLSVGIFEGQYVTIIVREVDWEDDHKTDGGTVYRQIWIHGE